MSRLAPYSYGAETEREQRVARVVTPDRRQIAAERGARAPAWWPVAQRVALGGAILLEMGLLLVAVIPGTTWETWGLYTAYMGVAYVAGFVILIVPSGLGVREFFLTLFLVEGGESRPAVLLAVLLMRLAWTAAELVAVAVVYWLPGPEK